MSTCPENDIHSIYLDNELPAEYLQKYEAHLQHCAVCRATLERMRRLRSVFQEDSKSSSLDQHMLDQSFERLQSRLRYTRVIQSSAPASGRRVLSFVKFSVPAAAAAALLAVILPARFSTKAVQPAVQDLAFTANPLQASAAESAQQTSATLAGTNTPAIANNVVVNGNLPDITSRMQSNQESQPLTAQYTSLGSPSGNHSSIKAALTGVDIFRPEFTDQDTITIQITIPHMPPFPAAGAVYPEPPRRPQDLQQR